MRASLVFFSVFVHLVLGGCDAAPQRIDHEPSHQEGTGADSTGALAVVRGYYRAIAERRFSDAYRLWASEGAASGKTIERFEAGFANTVAVDVEVGAPGPIGAAAGSRYIEVPVRIHARLRDGTRQEFTGTYTLRRSVVDGATADQRAWRIYSAAVHPS
jgi:hypothetical protein